MANNLRQNVRFCQEEKTFNSSSIKLIKLKDFSTICQLSGSATKQLPHTMYYFRKKKKTETNSTKNHIYKKCQYNRIGTQNKERMKKKREKKSAY